MRRTLLAAAMVAALGPGAAGAEDLPPFEELLRRPVRLRPELTGVHPRVFVTREGLETLRRRARTTHREQWRRVLEEVAAYPPEPPPPPGPQERRSQNVVAFRIARAALAYSVERRPELLNVARRWMLAAADYEPWGYTYYKPNVDLAAGHLLYAVGWAYDLLYHDLAPAERERVRASLSRHARLVHDFFSPAPGKKFAFTQNHNFIPTAGLAVAALALLGEEEEAPRWAALARAHHQRAGSLLSPDGFYYEGFEYWIFSAPWLVHFLDAWEHATGEDLWEPGPYRNWGLYVAHTVLPNGHDVLDFGDNWEGPLTRARSGKEYGRVYPGGTLQSNYNLLFRVASRFRDPVAQAVAEKLEGFGHSNLEEFWSLLWRDPDLAPAAWPTLPRAHHFADSGVVAYRSSWDQDATVLAVRCAPPEGHRALALAARLPEWEPSTGHAHPDAGSFIFYARGRYLSGDTGYAGLPLARHHNVITVDGVGQGLEGKHDVWDRMPAQRLAQARIESVSFGGGGVSVQLDAAGAYLASTGLQRFRRSLTLEGWRLEVEDEVVLETPRPVSWYLHTDAEPRGESGRYVADLGAAVLEMQLTLPENATAVPQPTRLMAPGRPGSIEQGEAEQRGWELEIRAPAVRTARARFVLLARPGAGR